MINFIGEIKEDLKHDLERVFDQVSKVVSLPKRVKVNVIFSSKQEIRELNNATRKIDKVTDVLSYPYTNLKVGEKLKLKDYVYDIDPEDKKLTLGDIYICLDRAEEQAKEYGHSVEREVTFLICHGLLHLFGYDHIDNADEIEIKKLQDEIMRKIGVLR